MEKKLKALQKGKRSNKYFCKLALRDHVRECREKDCHLKATNTPKHAEGYKNLDKELMDLKIILDFYFDDHDNLYKKRIDKFWENLEK